MSDGKRWVYDDGGRAAAGFKGSTGDCVVRAIAIGSLRPYGEVYAEVNGWLKSRFPLLWADGKIGSARTGWPRPLIRQYLAEGGWLWTPTMGIGTGTKVHLDPLELPTGRIICGCSHHLVAVVNGIVHDTYDSTRGGKRCVYGYWRKPGMEFE